MLEFLYNALTRLRTDEEGQTMVEYGLILSLVSLAALAALTPLGAAISGIFTQITGAL